MGNCLKTQLKEAVQNDNLLKIDSIRIQFNSVASPSLDTNSFSLSNPSTNIDTLYVRVVSGDTKIVNTDQNLPDWNDDNRADTYFEVQPGTTFFGCLLNKNGVIELNGKYVLSRFSVASGFTIDLSNLYIPNCTGIFALTRATVKGNVESLITKLPLNVSMFYFLRNLNASYDGSIISVLHSKNMSEINISQCAESYQLSDAIINSPNIAEINISDNVNVEGSLSMFLNAEKTALTYPALRRIRCYNTPLLEKPTDVVNKLIELGVTIVD